MSFSRAVLFLPFVCGLAGAQTTTRQMPPPAGVTPPTVTTSVEQPQPAPDFPKDKVVLTIGEQKFTVGDLDKLIEVLPEQYRSAARGPARRQFADNLASIRILSNEARRRKLDESPGFKNQLAFQIDNILAGYFFQDLMANAKVDDAAVRKYYEEHKSEYEQVRARHILLRVKGANVPVVAGQKEFSDEEALAHAMEIRKKLVAGGDFAALARVESADTGSGANGGDLGTFRHGQMVPAFEKVAFSLPVGEISEPVKTQFGYHLIKVEQHEARSIDEVRPEIEKRLRPEIARQEMDSLKKKTEVVMDPAYFGPEPKPQAAPKQ
jgi:peptidyl-prolyl cis-trans isomerase C